MRYLKGRDHFGDIGFDGMVILKWFVGKYCVKLCTGLICYRIGTIGRLLWKR